MKTNAGAPARRAGLRATLLIAAVAVSGSGLLLAGCSSGSGSTASAGAASGESVASGGSAQSAAASGGQSAGAPGAAPAPDTRGTGTGATTARLVRPAQSIIYTASLTVRAADVRAAAAQATSIAAAAGGYVASEQDLVSLPGQSTGSLPGQSTVSLRLKIPVASYPAVLRQLSGQLGKQLSLTQQSQDVTGQVADVSSRVTSAKAAITQLRALLRRAGSVGGLLSVQDEINSQEASLESLQSQQRALAGETSYATVSVQLLSQHKAAVHHHARNKHGFSAGLSSGWHGLRAATAWLLTVAGAVLPFAAVLAVLAAGGWFTWRRIKVRRRSRPAPAA